MGGWVSNYIVLCFVYSFTPPQTAYSRIIIPHVPPHILYAPFTKFSQPSIQKCFVPFRSQGQTNTRYAQPAAFRPSMQCFGFSEIAGSLISQSIFLRVLSGAMVYFYLSLGVLQNAL